MAIRVKHGEGDIGALVQLAALAGAAQARAPEAPRITPMGLPSGGGGGRGGRVGGTLTLADYGRIRYPTAGEQMAEEKTRQMEYEKKRLLQEEAQERFKPVDYKYSQKQRAEIAQRENAKRDLQANPNFSDEHKALGTKMLDAEIAHILRNPSVTPIDPSAEQYPAEEGIGKVWMDEYGNIKTRKPDGEVITQVEYKDTREGLAAAHDRVMEVEKVKQEAALAKEMRVTKAKLATEHIDKLSPEGAPTGEKRHRTSAEVEEAMFRIYGSSRQQAEEAPTNYELEEQLRRRIAGGGLGVAQESPATLPQPAGATGALDRVVSDMDLKFTKEDQDLPERVRVAQAFLREARKRGYPDRDVSLLMDAAIQEAMRIGAEYNAAR